MFFQYVKNKETQTAAVADTKAVYIIGYKTSKVR